MGIELELEGFTPSSQEQAARLVSPLWTIVADGSLRNGGVEFITTGGLGGERLAAAIHQIQDALEVVNYDASWRCSTHMHVNMLDFTVNQVVRFLLVYAACEPVLFNFCGPYRKSSNFCTPMQDSIPFHRNIMSRMWDDAVSRRWPMQHCNKYVALNILPLFPDNRGRALGTVEFRGGRPLVNREDMFKQANLLLSIKEYVRNFTGTEEELLVSLSQGVHSTVYANGVSAGLEPSVDEMEQAMVGAWMLLKSYQEGLTNRANNMARTDDEDREELAELAPQRPRANPFSRFSATFNGIPAPATPRHLPDPNSPLPQFNTLETLRIWIGNAWPALLEQYQGLCSNDTETQMQTAYYCARSRIAEPRTSISWQNYARVLLNWAGNLTPDSSEQTPIQSLLRLREQSMTARLQDSPEPTGHLPGIPTQGERPTRVCYQQILGQTDWFELLGRIGYSGTARNIDVWNYLSNHEVRTKGRDMLQVACNNLGLGIEIAPRMSTFMMYNLLRYTGLASASHVWSADLPAYDNFMYVLHILSGHQCVIPFTRPLAFSTHKKMYWSSVNGPMYFDLPYSVQTRTREGQTPARTMMGVDIY